MDKKEYRHQYYLKHKEEILESNKRWQKNNKEKFYKILYKNRKKKAQELKEKGERYCWHSEAKRKELYEQRSKRIDRRNKKRKIQDNSNE